MAKDPAVLFYTSDFLSGTSFFSMEQKGQYITLLCEQHQLGHIPNQHMLDVCGSYDSPVIKKFIKDDKGDWYNERMEEEKIKRSNYCESRRKARQAGIEKQKKLKKQHTSQHTSQRMDNGNENINNNINNKKGILCPYDKILQLYHDILPDLPKTIKLTDTLKKTLKARWKDFPDIEWWENHFKSILDMPFLLGNNGSGWTASFQWLIGPKNMDKVLSGNYINKNTGNGDSPTPVTYAQCQDLEGRQQVALIKKLRAERLKDEADTKQIT